MSLEKGRFPLHQKGRSTEVLINFSHLPELFKYTLPIIYINNPQNLNLHKLEAQFRGDEAGSVDYYWDKEKNAWYLDVAIWKEHLKRKGIASRLLRKFVLKVGQNQPVFGIIAEDETHTQLAQKYLKKAQRVSQFTLSGPELEDLVLIKLLKQGNIRVTEVEIHYDPNIQEEDPALKLGASFLGITGKK